MLPPTLKEKSFFPPFFLLFLDENCSRNPSVLDRVYNLLFTAFKRIESTRFKVERMDTQPDRTLFAQRKQSAGNSI